MWPFHQSMLSVSCLDEFTPKVKAEKRQLQHEDQKSSLLSPSSHCHISADLNEESVFLGAIPEK